MPAPQIVSLPPFFQMSDGMRIVVTAVDATTGNTVSNVTVANVSIDVDYIQPDEVSEPVPLGQIVLIPGAAEAA